MNEKLSIEGIHLAPPNPGNITQLIIATFPLFVVFVYLLYDASTRSDQPIYNIEGDDDEEIINAWNSTPALIPLFDMMIVFMVFEGIFMLFLSYLVVFIPRRHRLMRSYLEKGESCLGDVKFENENKSNNKCLNRCRRRRKVYGEVVYPYRTTTSSDNDTEQQSNQVEIRKRVRLYQPYSRERTTILYIQHRPLSGQPKADVVIDILASENAQHQIQQMVWFSVVWLVFLLLGPLYLLYQMKELNPNLQDYENYELSKDLYIFVGILIIPFGSMIGMCLRWALYRHWIVNRGRRMNSNEDNNKSRNNNAEDSNKNKDNNYGEDVTLPSVFISELIGQKHSGEVSPKNNDMSSSKRSVISAEDLAAVTNDYSRMA